MRVTIKLEDDFCFSDEDYDKIVACAKMWGKPVEYVVECCLKVGSISHIMRNVDLLEHQLKAEEEKRNQV